MKFAKGDLVRLRADVLEVDPRCLSPSRDGLPGSRAPIETAVGIVLDIAEEHKIRVGNKSSDTIVTECSYDVYWVDLGTRVTESEWNLEKVSNEMD